MSKTVTTEESKLLIQDNLYLLFLDLRATSKRQEVLQDAIDKGVSLENINNFVQETRAKYKLKDAQKVEGAVKIAQEAAGANAGKAAVHDALMEFVSKCMSNANEVSAEKIILSEKFIESHEAILSNMFGWLPEKYHSAFLDNIKSESANGKSLDDIMLNNLLRFETALNVKFAIPAIPNHDLAGFAIDSYAMNMPYIKQGSINADVVNNSASVEGPAKASKAPADVRLGAYFDSLEAAYVALTKAQAELAGAEAAFKKVTPLIKKVNASIDKRRASDEKDAQKIIHDLRSVSEKRIITRHTDLANDLKIKAEAVADIINSQVIQDDIDIRSQKTWGQSLIDAKTTIWLPTIASLKTSMARAEAGIDAAEAFHRINVDVQNTLDAHDYGAASLDLFGRLPQDVIPSITNKGKTSLQDSSHKALHYILTGGRQKEKREQLSDKEQAVSAIIKELVGFSPEAQKIILDSTIKIIHGKLEAQQDTDFLNFVSVLREQCKSNPESEAVAARRSSPNPQASNPVVPSINKGAVEEMCNGLEPLFQANFVIAQKKFELENSKLHLTLEDSPEIAAFILKQIALGTYRNPVVRAAFFSTAGAILGPAAAALGIGDAAKDAIEAASKTATKMANLIKEGKDVKTAGLIAGADLGFDFALSKFGVQATVEAKAEFMQDIDKLVTEMQNPQRLKQIEAEAGLQIEAENKTAGSASSASSVSSKDKDDKKTGIVSNLIAEKLLSGVLENLGERFKIPQGAVSMVKDALKPHVSEAVDAVAAKGRGMVKEKLTPKELDEAIKSQAKEDAARMPAAVQSIADNLNKAFAALLENQVGQNPMSLKRAAASAAVAGALQVAVDSEIVSKESALVAAELAKQQLDSSDNEDKTFAPSNMELSRSSASSLPRISEPPSPVSSPKAGSSLGDMGNVRVEVLEESLAIASSARSSVSSAQVDASSPSTPKSRNPSGASRN